MYCCQCATPYPRLIQLLNVYSSNRHVVQHLVTIALQFELVVRYRYVRRDCDGVVECDGACC
jgi:hypothetical protein